jgi:hypothetical protein
LNWDIVDAMSTEKELTLTDGTVTEAGAGEDDEDAGAEDDVDDEEEQPAAIRAATPATATQPNRRMVLFLLPSSIAYTFHRNVRGYADAGHRGTRVSLCDET